MFGNGQKRSAVQPVDKVAYTCFDMLHGVQHCSPFSMFNVCLERSFCKSTKFDVIIFYAYEPFSGAAVCFHSSPLQGGGWVGDGGKFARNFASYYPSPP